MSSVYDQMPSQKCEKFFDPTTNPPWYVPQPGVDTGWGPGRSTIYCFGCHSITVRDWDTKSWPEKVRCDGCGQVISTCKPADKIELPFVCASDARKRFLTRDTCNKRMKDGLRAIKLEAARKANPRLSLLVRYGGDPGLLKCGKCGGPKEVGA